MSKKQKNPQTSLVITCATGFKAGENSLMSEIHGIHDPHSYQPIFRDWIVLARLILTVPFAQYYHNCFY